MRLIALFALAPLLAWGEAPASVRLAPGVHMLPIQDGTARALSDDGTIAREPTALPSGYWLSMTGYERLQGRMATQESIARVERARAETCLSVAAHSAQAAPRPTHPAWIWLVSLGAVLVGPAAFWLGKRQRPDPWRTLA